jgi:hypothetical protein
MNRCRRHRKHQVTTVATEDPIVATLPPDLVGPRRTSQNVVTVIAVDDLCQRYTAKQHQRYRHRSRYQNGLSHTNNLPEQGVVTKQRLALVRVKAASYPIATSLCITQMQYLVLNCVDWILG